MIEHLPLSKKFAPAELPEVYAPRVELLSHFHKAAVHNFIYVFAPAGSGKTVSALLWLAESGRKSVWIGLDEYDNAPAVFFKQLATGIFSLQSDNESMYKTLTDVNFSAKPVEQTIKLIAEMNPEKTPCAIILDDAHLITSGEILKALPAVLKRLPGNFVVLILSRHAVDIHLDIMPECIITEKHLRFSPKEIRTYFQDLGKNISKEEARFAYLATEGLAIGVNAITMSENKIDKGANIFAEYFEKNIWNTWDEHTREFCLKISVVDEFTTEIAECLSGFADSADIMKKLLSSNAFLSRLHEDMYRFHHLFQDFLRDKARHDINMSAQYKSAAEYYKNKGDYSLALRFWLDSGDYKGADTFLLLFMFENNRGHIAEYVDFLRMYFIRDFPEQAFKDFPALHVCCAWFYYMTGQYKEYEKHADAGYKNIAKIARFDPKFVEFAMLMYSVDHRSRLPDKLKRLSYFGGIIKKFSGEGIIRSIASSTHDLPFMHRSSFDYCDAHTDPKFLNKVRKSYLVHLLGDQSEFMLKLSEAGFFYEQNNLERALKDTEWLTEVETDKNSIELRVCLKLLRHCVLLAAGLQEEADEAFNLLETLVDDKARFFSNNFQAYKTKMALLNCDKAAARAWLDNYYVLETEHIELYLVYQHFTTARAYIVMGDYKKARKYAVMLREFAENFVRICDYGEASVLLASIEWTMGKKKDAIAILSEALSRLQEYDLIRVVFEEGAAVLPVLKRVATKTGALDYNGKLSHSFVNKCLLATHAFSKKYKGITACFAKKNKKPVKLSGQQLKIIKYLSNGYTNAMIMKETGLKITTIKTHTAIAYQKLGVHNSLDAVLKARELGFLD